MRFWNTDTDLSFEWSPPITDLFAKRIEAIFRSAWLGQYGIRKNFISGSYSNVDEAALALVPPKTKANFLANAIGDELQDWQNNKATYLCAYINGQLVGFASFSISPIGENLHQVYIRQLAVASPYQGYSIGKALLEQLEKKLPFSYVADLVTRKINTKALGFYQHIGFNSDAKVMHEGYDATQYVGMTKRFSKT